MKPKLWVTMDGRVIKIAKMTDSHLANAIAYVIRRGDPTGSLEVLLAEQASRRATPPPAPAVRGRRRIVLE